MICGIYARANTICGIFRIDSSDFQRIILRIFAIPFRMDIKSQNLPPNKIRPGVMFK